MPEDLLHDSRVVDDGDDAHRVLANRAAERVQVPDPEDKVAPAFRGQGIRRMRIAVADVLGWLAAGMTHQAILADSPELTEDDIRACLACAADPERRLLTAA